MLKFLFYLLILFDTQGVLDKYFSHVLLKTWVRYEAVRYGLYYSWEIDDNTSLGSCRRAFSRLGEGSVPPDEVLRYAIDNKLDNYFYDAMKFNYQCQQHFMRRMSNRSEEFDLLEEFQKLHKIYDILDDINRPQYVLWEKRKKCYQLKILLGDRDYDLGIIPACVPLRAFVVID